jgi:hypothetical protein
MEPHAPSTPQACPPGQPAADSAEIRLFGNIPIKNGGQFWSQDGWHCTTTFGGGYSGDIVINVWLAGDGIIPWSQNLVAEMLSPRECTEGELECVRRLTTLTLFKSTPTIGDFDDLEDGDDYCILASFVIDAAFVPKALEKLSRVLKLVDVQEFAKMALTGKEWEHTLNPS